MNLRLFSASTVFAMTTLATTGQLGAALLRDAKACSCPVMVKTRREPRKPHPSFALTAHPNGQWCKKIRGQVHFFGVWSDPEGALQRYRAVAGDLHAGRAPPRVSSLGFRVKGACQRLPWAAAGENVRWGDRPRWFEDCRQGGHLLWRCMCLAIRCANPALRPGFTG